MKKTNYVISDPEGANIRDMIPKFVTLTNKIKITGDIMDSTYISPEYKKSLEFKNFKSFNIRNLMYVVNNENVSVIFGNRDLTKLKGIIGFKKKHNHNHQM